MIPLSEQVAQASSLVGLLLALDALFTLEQARRIDDERARVGGVRSTKLRIVRLSSVGLALITAAAIASLTPLLVDVLMSLAGPEWQPVFAVFGLTYLLLVAMLWWQISLAVRSSAGTTGRS
jgi:hypothetical protein